MAIFAILMIYLWVIEVIRFFSFHLLCGLISAVGIPSSLRSKCDRSSDKQAPLCEAMLASMRFMPRGVPRKSSMGGPLCMKKNLVGDVYKMHGIFNSLGPFGNFGWSVFKKYIKFPNASATHLAFPFGGVGVEDCLFIYFCYIYIFFGGVLRGLGFGEKWE